jgi:hypothetical protein
MQSVHDARFSHYARGKLISIPPRFALAEVGHSTHLRTCEQRLRREACDQLSPVYESAVEQMRTDKKYSKPYQSAKLTAFVRRQSRA